MISIMFVDNAFRSVTTINHYIQSLCTYISKCKYKLNSNNSFYDCEQLNTLHAKNNGLGSYKCLKKTDVNSNACTRGNYSNHSIQLANTVIVSHCHLVYSKLDTCYKLENYYVI